MVRGDPFDLQQREKDLPSGNRADGREGYRLLKPPGGVGLSPESLGRGAKREGRGGPETDELGREGVQGDQMVRCHSRWSWEGEGGPLWSQAQSWGQVGIHSPWRPHRERGTVTHSSP